jgi:F-type H+-transporting ATPase subunit delta
VRQELEDLSVAVQQVEDLRALLDNPEVDSRVKSDVLRQVTEGGDELVSNFVRLLAQKGRAGEIPEIAAEFETLAAAEQQVLDVELTTAQSLSDEEFGRVVGRIEEASGRKVQASRNVDPNLIGGIVLQAGSLRLDASVRGRLERLRHELATARS